MEAEQRSNNREHTAVFGQKRAKMGVDQSDLTDYALSLSLFYLRTPVFGQKSTGSFRFWLLPFFLSVFFPSFFSLQALNRLSLHELCLSVRFYVLKFDWTAVTEVRGRGNDGLGSKSHRFINILRPQALLGCSYVCMYALINTHTVFPYFCRYIIFLLFSPSKREIGSVYTSSVCLFNLLS